MAVARALFHAFLLAAASASTEPPAEVGQECAGEDATCSQGLSLVQNMAGLSRGRPVSSAPTVELWKARFPIRGQGGKAVLIQGGTNLLQASGASKSESFTESVKETLTEAHTDAAGQEQTEECVPGLTGAVCLKPGEHSQPAGAFVCEGHARDPSDAMQVVESECQHAAPSLAELPARLINAEVDAEASHEDRGAAAAQIAQLARQEGPRAMVMVNEDLLGEVRALLGGAEAAKVEKLVFCTMIMTGVSYYNTASTAYNTANAAYNMFR